jgi:predicted nuclease with TOPRIM domain
MKTTILALLFLPLFVFLVTPLYAHGDFGNTSDPDQHIEPSINPKRLQKVKKPMQIRRKEIRQKLQEHRKELRQKREQIKQKIHQKRTKTKKYILEKHAKRLSWRTNLYYRRLNHLIEKLQNRIDKLTAQNINTATAQNKLDQAQDQLDQAKALADEAVSQFKTIDPNTVDNPGDYAHAARDFARQARTSFTEVVGLLKETIQIIRTLVPENAVQK